MPTDVLYTVSGLPGSLVGAYLVETPLGRAKTLAISTLATSAATVVFVFVSTSVGIVVSSMAVSFASTLMCTSHTRRSRSHLFFCCCARR